MAEYGVAPFPRGKTFHDGRTPPAGTAADPYTNSDLEGMLVKFSNTRPGTGGQPNTVAGGGTVTCMCVRNTLGAALTPGRLVQFETGFYNRRVVGYTDVNLERVDGIVDDHLPAAGVADNDLFWIVVEGECLVKTALATATTNAWSEGDLLVALTGDTAGATTSGRPQVAVTSGATNVLAKNLIHTIGRAMTANVSNVTNTDRLVDVRLLK